MMSAVTRVNRLAVMLLVNDAVMELGGWITGHQLYGNISAVFRFELPENRLPAFAARMNGAGIRLDTAGLDAAAGNGDATDAVPCSLAVTFIHDEPDRKRTVPRPPLANSIAALLLALAAAERLGLLT